ncbi:MAG TPA: hypothetical protein VG347_10190 [Verrucomicrobiae bacterium]|nr:hypothetical protein [Verrucomicrobiae bacterium]
MQPLDLLPTAPVSTNTIEASSPKDNTGKPAPDGEFGRLMERAMSPERKAKGNADNLPHKGKTATALAKSHAGKIQTVQDAASSDIGNILSDAGTRIKTKATTSQTDASPTASKETTSTDQAPAVSPLKDDASLPLPIFLSLPLADHLGNGNANAETMVLAADASATQPAAATDGTKVLATLAANTAITAVGKNFGSSPIQGKILPEKLATKTSTGKTPADKSGAQILVSGDKASLMDTQTLSTDITPAAIATSIAALGVDPKTSPPTIDAKMTPSPASQTSLISDPIKTEKAVKVDSDPKDPAPATGIPAQTDDKIQVVSSFATKPAESLKNDGTGVAITASSMKNSDKTNKVAGLDVQVLPGGTNSTLRETVLPAHATVTAVRSADKQTSDLNLPLAPATPAIAEGADTSSLVALPSLADARMRDVERTHDLVSVHALRMVDSKSDSLQMVLKPGAGTEISLELHHRDGGVEAEAVLQRGDYQLMNQHWPELQAKLEQRGIKLAPLGGEANSFTTGNNNTNNGNFSRQQPSREEAAQQASAFAEFTVAMNRGGATARLAPAIAGGWESWA